MSTALARDWRPDDHLEDFDALTIPLRVDPDGAEPVDATLVRAPRADAARNGAVLYVHGFTDYFFNAETAAFFTDRGFDFFALDLRRCGRSMRDEHIPHFTTDLARYGEELTAALDIITAELADSGAREHVIVAGHSTGGLTTSLWLDALRTDDPVRHARISGLLLNSPWFDLQGEALLRSEPVSLLIKALGWVIPTQTMPRELSGAYGASLYEGAHGEWSYDLRLKPIDGFPVTFGWISAVRSGHRRLHRGIEVGVPALVLRSDKSRFVSSYRPEVDTADCVLDVKQIAARAGCLGSRVCITAVPDAKHDVFLSNEEPRRRAYAEVDTWLTTTVLSQSEGASQ